MRVLVTGAAGFAGRHLVDHLVDCGDVVVGLGHEAPSRPIAGLERFVVVDIADRSALAAAVAGAHPEVIYHLAAVSVLAERDSLEAALDINLGGSLNLLAAAAAIDPKPAIMFASSAQVYAAPVAGQALSETDLLAPATVYGASKAAAESALINFGRPAGVRIVIARAFNHIGPGQHDGFVVPSIAKQVAAIATGRAVPVLLLGSLTSSRDFSDVRDIVRAYRLIADAQHGDVFNVGSGNALTIGSIVSSLTALAGIGPTIEKDPALLRRGEPPVLRADIGRIKARFGWSPEIDLGTTLADVLAEAMQAA
jgi:GDP-4-dehydro-6-deoxy-D-mannose reductase